MFVFASTLCVVSLADAFNIGIWFSYGAMDSPFESSNLVFDNWEASVAKGMRGVQP